MNNVNNKFKDSGYVPFNLNSINKKYTLDSILIWSFCHLNNNGNVGLKKLLYEAFL